MGRDEFEVVWPLDKDHHLLPPRTTLQDNRAVPLGKIGLSRKDFRGKCISYADSVWQRRWQRRHNKGGSDETRGS